MKARAGLQFAAACREPDAYQTIPPRHIAFGETPDPAGQRPALHDISVLDFHDHLLRFFVVRSVHRLEPVPEKELLLTWQKRFRWRDDRPQYRRHLKADENENTAP